jgi:hypothetical protein
MWLSQAIGGTVSPCHGLKRVGIPGRTPSHRVVTDGISPEHAVDETIARIKQISSD